MTAQGRKERYRESPSGPFKKIELLELIFSTLQVKVSDQLPPEYPVKFLSTLILDLAPFVYNPR